MMVSAAFFAPISPPEGVFDVFRREFEAAYEDGGLFQLTTHPHIIGYRSRIWIIEELIRLAPEQWHLLQPNWPSDHDAAESGR